jgi:hypothetical protein
LRKIVEIDIGIDRLQRFSTGFDGVWPNMGRLSANFVEHEARLASAELRLESIESELASLSKQRLRGALDSAAPAKIYG